LSSVAFIVSFSSRGAETYQVSCADHGFEVDVMLVHPVKGRCHPWSVSY
jgi:hypothetical protein